MDEPTILLIEDNQESIPLLEKIITAAGYKVVVSSPQQARDMLKVTADYALIVTELHMPGINAAEITRLARERKPQQCVLILTATAFIAEAVEVMEQGAYGYVSKPFNAKEITLMLRRAVGYCQYMQSEGREKSLAELSYKDALTGVYNRRALDTHLKRRIEALRAEPLQRFSVAMVDVDNFKKFNDTQGHQAGDELLAQLARIFKESVRERDVVFRYGGEEFCLYFAATTKKDGALIADRIRTLVSIYLATTISMGVACFPEDGASPEALIEKADQALYQAKQTGKNKVVLAE